MEFYYSSDEEIQLDLEYDKFQHTPYTDPSVIKKLWREHFSRDPDERNREITRAFEMKCSVYQFIHPDLSREEVKTIALDDIGVKPSSRATKCSKKPLAKISQINEEGQEHVGKSAKKLNKRKKSVKNKVGGIQVQNKISKLSNRCKHDKPTLQNSLSPSKKKLTNKPIALQVVRIKTSQTVCKSDDLNKNKHVETDVKNIRKSGVEIAHPIKTTSGINTTAKAETLTNTVYVTKKDIMDLKPITSIDTPNNALKGKNTRVQKITAITLDGSEIIAEKSKKTRFKCTKVKGQENISQLNTTKTKVSQDISSKLSTMVFNPNVWKKARVTFDPLQNLTSLGKIKHKTKDSNKEMTEYESSRKRDYV